MGYSPVIRNRAKCLLCGDIIESMSHYDYKTCSCGNLAVDGGHEYTRRVCKTGITDFEELSEYGGEPEDNEYEAERDAFYRKFHHQ